MTRLQGILITTILLIANLGSSKAQAQQTQTQTPLPYFSFGKGLGITAPDSTFSINLRFRIQNRVAFTSESDTDLAIKEVEARVRRLRLRFDGFAYTPKLTYVIQLSFSNGDMEWETTKSPNIIRDAYIQYAPSKNVAFGIGQTKLPGNRQRVTSSGDQQLVDRSIANAAFNIDRDFGAQFLFRQERFGFRGAITTGEGRNSNTSDNGLAYTGRVEFFPFGQFTKGNDYVEGDLAREKTPKLSIGIVGHQNEKATRTGGQTGSALLKKRDLSSQFVDVLFKYNGWALSGEYLSRSTHNPVTEDGLGNTKYVYVGDGQNYQLSYLFKNNFELVGRYTAVNPAEEIQAKGEKTKEHFALGVNKYLKGHRVKLQSDLTLEQWTQEASNTAGKFWICRFQIEMGI